MSTSFPLPGRRFRAIFVSALISAAFISACSDQEPGPAAPGRASLQTPHVIRVVPNGVDDTESLRAAIAEATVSGPGATVLLSAGEFRSNFLILQNFNGTIKGEGAGRTLLRNIDRLDFGNVQSDEGLEPTYDRPWPVFITAIGGKVEIADMTIRIVGPEPAVPYQYLGETWDIPQYILRVAGERVDSRITGVRFEGEPGSLIGYNTFLGVYWAGTLDGPDPLGVAGRHALVRSEFDGIPFPIGAAIENAHLTVGGSAADANIIHNSLFGLVINDAHNTSVDVTHNRVGTSWIGIRLWQGYFYENHPEVRMPAPTMATFNASHNRILVDAGGEGITVRDAGLVLDGSPRLSTAVVGNEITMNAQCAPGVCAAINISGADGGHAASNVVTGTADVGILIGRGGAWRLTGNDLSGFQARLANVLLGRLSRNNKVSGEKHGSVIDRGAGNVVAPSPSSATAVNAHVIGNDIPSAKYHARGPARRSRVVD
jgi:hypothetical protein